MNSKALPDNILRAMDPGQRKALGKSGATQEERAQSSMIRWERDLHKLISNDLLRRDVFAIHARMDKKSSIAVGTPDYCFVWHGVPIAMEVKMPGQEPTREQLDTRDQMQRNGWHWYLVKSFENYMDVINSYRGQTE